jgi:DNA-binding CsgD family transcriptional regulator
MIFSQVNGFRNAKLHFSNTELKFLQLICTEKTYKEIAADMGLKPRQVDYLREMMFGRFDVHSRVGLAFTARHSGILTRETV